MALPMSSWLRSRRPAAASASGAPVTAATMYWRVQMTWSAQSLRRAALSDDSSCVTTALISLPPLADRGLIGFGDGAKGRGLPRELELWARDAGDRRVEIEHVVPADPPSRS